MGLILFLFASRLTPHQVSDIECAKLVAEFNCSTSSLNRSGTNHDINRDMAEISSQTDESSKNSPIPVIYNACDNEESSCCDVESGMSSLVQDSKVEESNFVLSACDKRTVGTGENLVADNSSEFWIEDNTEGECIEENVRLRGTTKAHAGGDGIGKKEECLNVESPSTDEQTKLRSVQQLHGSESEDLVNIHIESNTLNSAETFNTFQYWRVPIPELQFDISSTETSKPSSVRIKAKVTDELTQQTFASQVNVDMDIDVSNLKVLSYYVMLLYLSPFSVQVML
jgi:hypothetical protein